MLTAKGRVKSPPWYGVDILFTERMQGYTKYASLDFYRDPHYPYWFCGGYMFHPLWIDFAQLPGELPDKWPPPLPSELVLEKQYEVDCPVDAETIGRIISREVTAFNESYQEKGVNPPSYAFLASSDPELSKVSPSGMSWVKRYKAVLYREYGIVPPEQEISNLFERIVRSSQASNKIVFDIVPHSNWKPGMFGEKSNSCWWGGYNSGRIAFFKQGGLALRFFDPTEKTKGIGRCWLYPVSENAILAFNAYHHKMSLASMTTLLSVHLFREPNIRYAEMAAKIPVYLNTNKGYVAYRAGSTPPDEVQIGRAEEVREAQICDICRNTVDPGKYDIRKSGILVCKKGGCIDASEKIENQSSGQNASAV